MKLVFLSCVLVAAMACGPKTGGGGGGGGATGVLPDVPFEQFNQDQKIQFMKQTVMPTMKPLFQGHDAGKFKNFGCKTCHGPDADQGQFHMPNDHLPKLNFSNMSKFQQHDIEWMKNEIKPTMARLLKEEEHS